VAKTEDDPLLKLCGKRESIRIFMAILIENTVITKTSINTPKTRSTAAAPFALLKAISTKVEALSSITKSPTLENSKN
jgi:hypothetical protein